MGATETLALMVDEFETFNRLGLIALFGRLLFTFDVVTRFREAAMGCDGVDGGGTGAPIVFIEATPDIVVGVDVGIVIFMGLAADLAIGGGFVTHVTGVNSVIKLLFLLVLSTIIVFT